MNYAPADQSDALIRIDGISKIYQNGETEIRALDDVSLSIFPGEFVAIMGQSGSGKSTLMNILGCLDRPDEGVYEVAGTDVASLSLDELAALRRDTFGFVFQRYNLLSGSTATENVEIPAIYAGVAKRDRVEKAHRLLERLGLGDRTEHRPGQLSGGQQQRVSIARALMNGADVILADEPTGALDSRSGAEVLELLKQLNVEGTTVILITHDPSVASHAQRVIQIQDGKIVDDTQTGAPVGKIAARRPVVDHGAFRLLSEMGEAVKIALRQLRVNLFRTALTLLGVVIGVAAVVTMLAIGEGAQQKVLQGIQNMGSNLLLVRAGGRGARSDDSASLGLADIEAIAELPGVQVAVGERQSNTTLRFGNVDYRTRVQGTQEGFPVARDWPIVEGTFFTDEDIQSFAPVTVLGSTAVRNLFANGEDPIGQYVMVGNVPFQVIGVLATKGASSFGQDMDDVALIPLTTGFMRVFGTQSVSTISVKVENAGDISKVEADIGALMEQRQPSKTFEIRNTASLLEMVQETQGTLTILLGSVAAISLLVGGIGVMNIMLVSVTERTREIGLRMATGARMNDILVQFNTEALVVCAIGGVVGVLLGVAIGLTLGQFDVAIQFTPGPAILAFSCAVATGLVFGYLPARKAARLDPVVALSSE
ncbi:MacB family efflux pump subunit [Iodidimonas sp. SYSU 1G8]|uniref:MacB family efflux pump subunit n=1 Tax=Iodidimonas sp. SYSU 1G8 TaxID=3133967 RepID=UPI0031FF0B0F